VEGDFDAVAGLFAVSGLGQVAFDELHGFEAVEVGAAAGNEVVDARTDSPRASKAAAMERPMKPAAPVTR